MRKLQASNCCGLVDDEVELEDGLVGLDRTTAAARYDGDGGCPLA